MENTNTVAILWGNWARYEECCPDAVNFYQRCDSVDHADEAFPIAGILMGDHPKDEIDSTDFDSVTYPSDWTEGYAVLEVSQAVYEVPDSITSFSLIQVGSGTSIQVYDEMIDGDDWDPMEMEEVIDIETGRSLGYDELW